MLSSASEFLINRGTDVAELTDYEIEERFCEAWKNEQHALVEQGFYAGLAAGWQQPREWREYCNQLHAAIEKPEPQMTDPVDAWREMYRQAGLPVVN